MMADAQPARRGWRGSVTVPILLIALGVVFLLQNYGLLPPRFWPTIGRLWPLLLVLFGVELLLGGRVGRLTQVAVVGLVLVIGVGATAAFSLAGAVAAGPRAEWTYEQSLDGASQAAVNLELGAGKIDLGALPAGGGQLATARLNGPPGVFERPRYRVRDGAGDFALDLRGDVRWAPFLDDGRPVEMGVQLTQDVPLTLRAEMGAADARLDLSALKVSRLDLRTGASTTWLRLPEAAGTTTGRVRSGAASLAIEVPPGVAAQIRYEGGVSSVDVDEARFPLVEQSSRRAPRPPQPPAPPRRQDDFVPPAPPVPPGPPVFLAGSRLYRSPDYDTAANKVDLTVESGASTITVR